MVNVILNFANHFHQCYSSSMFLSLDNQFFFSCMFSAVTREIGKGVCVTSSVNLFQFLPGIFFKAHQNVDCSSKSERLILKASNQKPTEAGVFLAGASSKAHFCWLTESKEAAGACWCTAPVQQQKHKICRPLFLSFSSDHAPAILQHMPYSFSAQSNNVFHILLPPNPVGSCPVMLTYLFLLGN